MSAEETKIMKAHFQWAKQQVAKKVVIAAGPVLDPVFGLYILRGESHEKVRERLDREPSVSGGVHTYEISPMHLSLLAGNLRPERYVRDPSDRILYKEVRVSATLGEVWEDWTTTKGVESFFSENARVELRAGGPFEIYLSMDAPPGLRGSEDCRILSFLKKKMLSFEWNAPPSFGPLRDQRTRVIIFFSEPSPGKVLLQFSHTGWGKGEDWDKLYDCFDNAWGYVLGNFEKRFEHRQSDTNW